jgi:4-nitrophenyl phosphatase
MTSPDRLRAARGFVLDADGTLVLGTRDGGDFAALPGAAALTALLTDRGIPYAVFTNGSAKSPGYYVDALRAVGLTLPDEGVLTPVSSAIDVLRARGHHRVLVLGTPDGIGSPLTGAGLQPLFTAKGADASTDVDAVLIGLYRDFGMADLDAAYDALSAGAALYTCSDARFVATATGTKLGTSRAIAGAIHAVTDVRAELVGKPSHHAIDTVARRLGVPPHELVIVGDDPDLEIAMARHAGAFGVLVGDGVSSDADLRLDGVDALVALLEPTHRR